MFCERVCQINYKCDEKSRSFGPVDTKDKSIETQRDSEENICFSISSNRAQLAFLSGISNLQSRTDFLLLVFVISCSIVNSLCFSFSSCSFLFIKFYYFRFWFGLRLSILLPCDRWFQAPSKVITKLKSGSLPEPGVWRATRTVQPQYGIHWWICGAIFCQEARLETRRWWQPPRVRV